MLRASTRRLLDRSFTGAGVLSIVLMAAALVIILAPMFLRGAGAFVFRGTIEHRRVLLERFHRGDRGAVAARGRETGNARATAGRTGGGRATRCRRPRRRHRHRPRPRRDRPAAAMPVTSRCRRPS